MLPKNKQMIIRLTWISKNDGVEPKQIFETEMGASRLVLLPQAVTRRGFARVYYIALVRYKLTV